MGGSQSNDDSEAEKLRREERMKRFMEAEKRALWEAEKLRREERMKRFMEAEKRRLEEAEKRFMEAEKRFMEAEKRRLEERRRLRKGTERSPPQSLFTEQEAEKHDDDDDGDDFEGSLWESSRHRRGAPRREFKLIGSSKTEYPSSAVTLSCNLSPELSAVDLEIRWFKETECVHLYKNRQVTEGKGYEDRVSLFRDELEKGNVSLQLKNCSWSDLGDYLCQVTDGDTTEELTVRMADPQELPSPFSQIAESFSQIAESFWGAQRPDSGAQRPPLQRVFTEQTDRQWTNEERLKMEKSSLLIDENSFISEFMKKCSNLEKTQEELKNTKLELEQVMETNQNKLERLEKELQDKNSQIQDMMILVEQWKTELLEKNKELEEKERQLQEKDKQLQEKDKQLQEDKKQLQEIDKQLQEIDKQLQENEKQLKEKDTQLQENEKQLQENEKQLQENEKQLQENEKQLQEDKKQLQENDKQLQEKDKQLEENKGLLSERETQHIEKDKQLQEKDKQLQENEKQLQEKHKQLEEIERLLSERETQYMEKDNLKEEQLHERTDPDPSVPIRRKNSIDLPPHMSGESSGADPPESVPATELRLVLLGRSGSGKTAAGNTILGREERSQAGTSNPTQQSESTQEEVAGRKVTVMDTPDWFCSELPLDKLRQDVGRCVHLSAPGPHAFLLVLPVKQATGEERGMQEKMEEIFGDRCWRNTMIIFTVSDELQKENIEAFVQSGNQEVQRLVEKCGNRFHCINIKQSGDGSQVSELLEKIEKMERFYSSEIYLETESQIRAMEATILKERGEKRMKEERQMKEKLEKQVEESLRKLEGVIQDHEGDIRQLNDRTTELERKMKEERDEEKKRELEKELEREVERRTEMEKEVNRLKEKRVKERREMEEKHEQNMEELREMYEGEARIEAERNLMKIIMPELQRNILASKTKMQEEFSRQMEEKDLEVEKLQQRLSELTQTHSVLEEVYERTVKSTAEAEGAAPAEQSKGITQKVMGLFR